MVPKKVRAFEKDTDPLDVDLLAMFRSLCKKNANEASATKGKEEASASKARPRKQHLQLALASPV
jgi:hypothetical protein